MRHPLTCDFVSSTLVKGDIGFRSTLTPAAILLYSAQIVGAGFVPAVKEPIKPMRAQGLDNSLSDFAHRLFERFAPFLVQVNLQAQCRCNLVFNESSDRVRSGQADFSHQLEPAQKRFWVVSDFAFFQICQVKFAERQLS